MSEGGHPDMDTALAAWAVGACPADEAARIGEHVASCAACARAADRLNATAGTLAEAVREAPPPALRAAVLAAARRRRPGLPARLTEAYARQVAGMDALLSSLTPAEWRAPVPALGPVPKYGSVREVVGHLARNDAAFAGDLGLARGERAAAGARAGWHAQADALVRGVTADAGLLDRETSLAGAAPVPATGRTALVQRAFETWTHADDIRAVVGRPPEPPPGEHLRLIVEMAVPLLPRALRAAGRARPGRTARLRLTGAVSGEWTVPLAPGAAPAAGRPGVTVTADAEEFCRLLANRRRPEAFPHVADGDPALAADLLRAAATLGCD
ncbi:maleylpyruvate isomerase family mycothiol-dependent enzyme [Actinomadura sp. 21ATH]|uniref:maleylpyruvate isomerase family mycothiol-dependent enzyme n=1 Tax=Actinomadura sp. 21ATH TaxID=1735444 RepID=UPI0035C0E444